MSNSSSNYKKTLVIPSNRQNSLKEFFKAWDGIGGWDDVILVEDGPESSFSYSSDRPVKHYCWSSIEKIVGEDSWIFSRKDSAIRCFGFLAAYHRGAWYILTLDDDCFPHLGHENIFERHLETINNSPVWTSSIRGVRTRGLPYKNLGTLLPLAANVGLWSGNPDLDAQTQIIHNEVYSGELNYCPPNGSTILAPGQLAPLSGMNLCISRQALPLFYFPLMGEGQIYSRFDDIWAGIIAKLACDYLGLQIAIGEPFVKHIRASNPEVNLIKESPGLQANENFWEEIKDVFDKVSSYDYSIFTLLYEVGYALEENKNSYLAKLGKCLKTWHSLFRSSKVDSLIEKFRS